MSGRILRIKLRRDLWRLRGQALAIAGVVAAGIAVLIAMFGTVDAIERSQRAFYERYRFADVFAAVRRAPRQRLDDIARIDGVASVEGRVSATVTLDVPGMAAPATGRLLSVPDDREALLNLLFVKTGRLPRASSDEVVVSTAFAEAHTLAPGDTLAAIMNGRKRTLTVVGVALSPEFIYALGPGEVSPDNKRFGVLWMSERTLDAAFDLHGAFNDLAVGLLRGAREEEVIRKIDLLLRDYGGTGAYGREDQLSHFFLINEFLQLRSFGSAVPPIFLGVAAFLLNLIIGRLVDTEREQIGLFKAFGYGNLQVGLHYTQLVLALSILGLAGGGILGYWLGDALVDLYGDYFTFPLLAYEVHGATFAIAAMLTLGAAAVGGATAVRRAFRLSPAVAMAPPMPTHYRPGMLATLMQRLHISQPTRMIVRHLTRWPLRTALTATGIAFSMALMIMALFFVGSVEHVIDVFYFQAQRQHMTVTFLNPEPARIEWELARLPGVLQTQPARVIPVTLRAGPYSERQSVVGMAPGGTLSRTLDRDLRAFSPPERGIALSSKLAEDLHVGLGDSVTVQAMEGRRPVVDLEVTALVEEYLGFATYMPLKAVNRLMREGPVISEVHLLIDSAQQAALDARLKNTPGVAGIVQQQASLRSFRKTLDQTTFVQVFIYTMFSGIVAFGVSYNSARIALGERFRALASLRVLGFSRGEVSYILIGELAITTLLALPLGLLLGLGLVQVMAPLLKTDMYQFPAIIDGTTIGWALIVVLTASVICWWMVHRRLQRLNPAEALKTRD